MEESNSSVVPIIGTIIAVAAIGGIGYTASSDVVINNTEAHTVKINILPSQKFTAQDGTEYKLGDEIKLQANEKLVGTYSSNKCPSEIKEISEEYSPIFSGAPLCVADCSDDNSENLELLADKVDTCDEYFNLQLAGTATEAPDESSDEEDLVDFPEDYIFGEEVE